MEMDGLDSVKCQKFRKKGHKLVKLLMRKKTRMNSVHLLQKTKNGQNAGGGCSCCFYFYF